MGWLGRLEKNGDSVRPAGVLVSILIATLIALSVPQGAAIYSTEEVRGSSAGSDLGTPVTDDSNVSITQSPTSVNTTPGTNVTIEVALTIIDRNAPAINLSLPDDWQVVAHEENRSAYYRADVNQWVWIESISGKRTKRVRYTVRIPSNASGGDRGFLVVGSAINPETDKRETDSHTTRVAVEAPTQTPTESGTGGDGGPRQGPSGDVEIVNRTLLNETVTSGMQAVVRVDLANYEPARGQITLNYTVDGSVMTDRTIAVGASSTRTVFLRYRLTKVGTYTLGINAVPVGMVTVEDPRTQTDTRTTTPTQPSTSEPTLTTAIRTESETGRITPTQTRTVARMETTTSSNGAGLGSFVMIVSLGLTVLALYRHQY